MELPDSNTNPYIIGIVGGSASGKTELLHQLHGRFKTKEVSVLSQDDYHKPIELQKKDENETVNFDLPEAIEADQLIQDIQQLKQGNRVTVREYTFNQPGIKPTEKTIHPSPILLIEGLFLFYFEAVAKELDLKIFMDAREDIRFSRRLKRDKEERGIHENTILYQWHYHVHPAYKHYLLPYRDDADLIITNHHNYQKGIELLNDHIKAVIEWKTNLQS